MNALFLLVVLGFLPELDGRALPAAARMRGFRKYVTGDVPAGDALRPLYDPVRPG